MRHPTSTLALLGSLLAASLALAAPAAAKNDADAPRGNNGSQGNPTHEAVGTPQRSSETPPGLQRAFDRQVKGILNALNATANSNSRLQDLPVSP